MVVRPRIVCFLLDEAAQLPVQACVHQSGFCESRNVALKYNAMLKLEDFEDTSFLNVHKKMFAHRFDLPGYPAGFEMAKAWEMTVCARTFLDHGVLRPDAEVLGVAAGSEHTAFWLTNYVKRVFVTDLYLMDAGWKEANRDMLIAPERFAVPGTAWNPDRMVVQNMDALSLRYEDCSFDGVFSCGSIEHFGSLADVARSMAEVGRVLKPGGIAVISTEFRIDGPDGVGVRRTILFTREMLYRYIVKASGLELIDEPDWETTPATAEAAYSLDEAVLNGVRNRSVALRDRDYTWTSGAVCLRKPAN